MNGIYVTGGELRQSVFRKLMEWQSSQKAVILEFDPESKKSRTCIEYISPSEVCSDDLPAILFKSASIADGRLYACTSTEVLVYALPGFELLHYISLPCFNDLHHVCLSCENTLLVVTTGLEMVVEVTLDGKVLREWNVLGEDPWTRFSRDIDYRKVASTKPHRAHPNHVFLLDDEIWATRFEQRDAISLTRPGRRIDIGVQRPHDGYVFRDSIYFTTVDGKVIRVNQKSLQIEQIHDLTEMSGPREQILGWCRGVLPLDDRFAWAGFTRVRPTKFRENLAWIRSGGNYEEIHRPTHLALYDFERKQCVDEVPLEPHGIGVVFSLLPAV